MPEPDFKTKVLTSDPNVLHKIKSIQFLRQLIPLIIVVILMVLNFVWPQPWIFYPTLLAFGWYLLERILFRTRHKILAPGEGVFVAPVDGKVQSIRKIEDDTMITIRKSFLDIVEVRLPFPGLQMENTSNWNFETPKGQVNIRFQTDKLNFFGDKNIHGAVIGILPGTAMLAIRVPASAKIMVQEKQNLIGGESILLDFEQEPKKDEERPSIIVD